MCRAFLSTCLHFICFLLAITDCFERDIVYVYGRSAVHSIKDVFTYKECQWKCQQIPTCNFFSYAPKNLTLKRKHAVCLPKIGIALSRKAVDYISGPKFCNSTSGNSPATPKEGIIQEGAQKKNKTGGGYIAIGATTIVDSRDKDSQINFLVIEFKYSIYVLIPMCKCVYSI